MKEFFLEAVAVAVGVIIALILAKKVLKIDTWESDSTTI